MREHNRVRAEISLDAILYNMKQLKNRLGEGARMIAVIKADGYGHGAVPIARVLEPLPYVWGFAVACLDEAEELREAGVKKPILVLGGLFPDEYADMVQLGVRPTVYSLDMAKRMAVEAVCQGKTLKLHIKIDTGMGRLGFPVSEESADIIRQIQDLPAVQIEGVYTHFARADETDKTYTYRQHADFLRMKGYLEERGVTAPFYNCDNSAGIIDFPQMKHDLARVGIALYGLYPSDEVDKAAVDLKPAMSLISHVSHVKEVPAGTSISYGGTFVTKAPTRVATIPVGYADGYPRSLSNRGEVLIRGKRAKILGRICMDQFMADVTDIPDAAYADPVTLVGRDGEEEITVDELSALSGRFPYEFVCCVGKRVPRVYANWQELI